LSGQAFQPAVGLLPDATKQFPNRRRRTSPTSYLPPPTTSVPNSACWL